MEVHHHYHDSKTDNNQIIELLTVLVSMSAEKEDTLADLLQSFADLKAKVAAQATVDNSVLVLVQGLRNQLAQLAQQETIDPAEVQALADRLAEDQVALTDAVSAGLTPPAKIFSITDGVDAPVVPVVEPTVEPAVQVLESGPSEE